MKNKFVRCLSPITAGVTLAMLIAVAFNGYYSVTKIIQSPDWKTAVYLFVELVAFVHRILVAVAIVVLMIKEIIKTGVYFGDDRVEFTGVDDNNVFEYSRISRVEAVRDTKASLKKNFVDRYSRVILYLDDDSVVTVELGLTSKKTLDYINNEFKQRLKAKDN